MQAAMRIKQKIKSMALFKSDSPGVTQASSGAPGHAMEATAEERRTGFERELASQPGPGLGVFTSSTDTPDAGPEDHGDPGTDDVDESATDEDEAFDSAMDLGALGQRNTSFRSSFGGGNQTSSFGSNWDDNQCASAQLEQNPQYQEEVSQGEPAFYHMMAAGMPAGMMPMPAAGAAGMPVTPMVWGGYPAPLGTPMAMPQLQCDGGASAQDRVAQLEFELARAKAWASQVEEVTRRARAEAGQEGVQGAWAGEAWTGGSSATSPEPAPTKSIARRKKERPSITKALSDRTTVMLRNLPNDYTREMLLSLLDSEGFKGKYDFVYLPVDFKREAGLGYAFVNLISNEEAENIRSHFNGFQAWKTQSQKICEVAWGDPLQGLEEHIDRYRNSPVMHPDVTDEAKPALFKDGVRIAFPEPTKRIRLPRFKHFPHGDHRTST